MYTVVEHVDKNFLKLHFKNNTGLLMKPEAASCGLDHLGDDWARYKTTPTSRNAKRRRTRSSRVTDFTGNL